MDSSIKFIIHNIALIIWFLIGGLISVFSYYGFGEPFSNNILHLMTKPLKVYYEYSNDNKSIITLFWFYLLTTPIALFFHCKSTIASKKIDLPSLYISLFSVVFMLAFMSFIFLLRSTPIDFNNSGKFMGLLHLLITSSWWSTLLIYSLIWLVLFNSISSSINHYFNKIELKYT